MKLNRNDLNFLLVLVVLIVFIIPFLFLKDDKLEALSVSFTAVGAFATIFTAFIAIALYDKFGVDQKFVIKQTDKVLELVDLLKGKVIVIKAGRFNYMVRPSKEQLMSMNTLPFFSENSLKKLTVSADLVVS